MGYNRHTNFYISNIEAIDFCGNSKYYSCIAEAYEIPSEAYPTTGIHDFNTCETCKENLSKIISGLTIRFIGDGDRAGFPFCCDWHKNLVDFADFKREDFIEVPRMTAYKIIYTIQHIQNNINDKDWFELITDYIDYVVDSFGKMPNNCGEPLFISNYIKCVEELIEDTALPKIKADAIIGYLKLHTCLDVKTEKRDINILISTYDKWFKLFPFQLSYFSAMKDEFTKLPLFESAHHNIYSNKVTVKPHTKAGLINLLVDRTSKLLSEINALQLYEHGLLTKPQQVKLELVINERRFEVEQGYASNAESPEQRYINTIKKWFSDEKRFIEEITPFLTEENESCKSISHDISQKKINADKLKVYFNSHFKGMGGNINYFDTLIEDLKIERSAKEIAQIAVMIYNSKMSTKMPPSFKKWYRVFCECIGVKMLSYDNTIKLQYSTSDKLKRTFNYL